MLTIERENSKKIFEQSQEVIPGGVNSPVRAFQSVDLSPMIVREGNGAYIWDVDGKKYIDFCMSWGALILGHAPPSVVAAASAQLKKGSSFGIATEIEEKFARLLVESMPALEQVRFLSSGTEATMTAVRLARGHTKRPFIIKFDGNYHGHADPFLVKSGSYLLEQGGEASSEGIPKEVVKNTLSFPYNEIKPLKEIFNNPATASLIAGVIIEPIAGNIGLVPAKKEFLEFLREKTKQTGALLIFDEVITGFRVGLGGAAALYGIDPDLVCLGKIIGGGLPGAAVGGKRKIMETLAPTGRVFQAGTLSGNPVVMQAGMATIEECRKKGFYEALEQRTKHFCTPIQEALKEKKIPATIQRIGSMFTLFWGVEKVETLEDLKKLDQQRFKEFFRYLFKRGVYIPPSPYEVSFVSTAHGDEELERAQGLVLEFLDAL
ncbi:MAG: glutamate-1-semialdehyde 2,1-aminomutase [Simkania negevensis]|nr:glutamate-1-semialdehyde 2,1-aminomutase [Simkania negevensis]